MTRLHKRTARRRTTDLDESRIRHLLFGVFFLRDDGFGDVDESTETDAEMRTTWNDCRDRLLADWLAAYPRSRPYAWWRFDAPEPRRRIDGKPHPFDDPRRHAAIERAAAEYGRDCWLCRAAHRLYFGTPQVVIGDGLAEYESEAAYLERLGRLTDPERAKMPLG